jgi:hypothetical protein
MAMRTIKEIYSPGRFTLEEAVEAARSLKTKVTSGGPSIRPRMPEKAVAKTPAAKKAPAKKSR